MYLCIYAYHFSLTCLTLFADLLNCRWQSGADVLFVMNYPGYVGQSTVDAEYHISHPGLGYKYTSEQVNSFNLDARVIPLSHFNLWIIINVV